MNKRSQVTLYILLAIVIIGSLIFLVLPKQKPGTQFEDLRAGAELISKSDSIRFYVESCLEQATKEAVKTLGVQGGYIYETQAPGTVTFFGPVGKLCGILPSECVYSQNLIPYKTMFSDSGNVSYAIKSPVGGYGQADYPYKGSLRASDKVNTFGVVSGGEKEGSIIELCYLNGPNDASIAGAEYSCSGSYSTLGKSIQSFLERYIENKTLSCADFSTLSIIQGVEIKPKNITAKVLIGDNDLIASINYELLLRFSGSKPDATQSLNTMADFSYTLDNMRLKQVYELAYYLAQAETSNLFFDVTSEKSLGNLMQCTNPQDTATRTSCLRQGMEVNLIRDPCPSCEVNKHSDIIQIIDRNSEIDGIPYIFQFGIANRPPALDLIDKDIQQSSLYYNYLAQIGKLAVYKQRGLYDPSYEAGQNIIVGFEDTLEIYPWAFDPDETPVIYNYLKSGSDTIGQRLRDSSLFQTTHRDAEIALSPADIGEHKFRLVAVDNEDGADWQDIKVMVCNTKPNCVDCATCQDPDCPSGCLPPKNIIYCCS